MNNKKNIYITTPIYYVNDSPHIGHAYTTIAADTLAKFYRLHNYNVFFLTGTDEHGHKIEESALSKGITPKELVDNVVETYKNLWASLEIEFDGFIRTTDEIHKKTVQKIFEIMYEKGDIYKGNYEGWYCTPCETYFPLGQLGDDLICPDCGRALKKVSEEAYFFKLSKYQDKLLEIYKTNPLFLSPESRSKEIINFVKSGLEDLCVTRSTVKWGIEVPFDKKHCIYVWFDALINYISAIGFTSYLENKDNKFKDFWPAIHLMGKEIFKFHTVIWPAMLQSIGVEIPKICFAHGWWTLEGKKMSKSLGNVCEPLEITEKYGNDVLRYFLLREVSFGNDGNFAREQILARYNSDLANDIGNLVSRTLKMAEKYFNYVIYKTDDSENSILKEKTNSIIKIYNQNFENIKLTDALNNIFDLVSMCNKYIDDTQPWNLAKDENNKIQLQKIIFELLCTIKIISVLLYPFMPKTSFKIWELLGLGVEIKITSWEEHSIFNVKPVTPLFPRKEALNGGTKTI